MNACKQCGKPARGEDCPDCRYRHGGLLMDQEVAPEDLVDEVLKHSRKHFRDGFTSDQLQQVSESER